MKKNSNILLAILVLFSSTNIIKAQWGPTYGPWGNTVASCFAHYKEKLYAGSESKGVFLSTNQGITWKSINSDLPDTSVLSLLAIDDTIFAGTYNALFNSTNNGENWNSSGKGLPKNTRIYSLARFDSILFAGTSGGGIYRSSDYGKNWINVYSGIATAVTKDFTENNGKIFAVINLEGIMVSSDNGITWEKSLVDLADINFIVVKDGIIFSGNLFISNNNGETWETSNSLINESLSNFVVMDSSIFAGTGNGVLISTDNGKNWEQRNEGLPDKSIYILYSLDKILFASTFNKGVFQSTDYGLTWHPVDLRYKDATVNCLIKKDNRLYAGTFNGIFRSDNNGKNWIPINSGLTSYDVTCLALNDNCIFAGTYDGVFKSTNDGINWTSISSGLANKNIRVISTTDSKIYLANTSDTLFVSNNNGNNWNPLKPIENLAHLRQGTTSIAIIDSNIFMGTMGAGIFLSTNGGMEWSSNNNGLTDLKIYALNRDKNYLYAGTNSGIFLSTNEGKNWKTLSNKMQAFFVNSIAIWDSLIFVGNGNNVFFTRDNGIHWIGTGLKESATIRFEVSSLIIQDSIIFAGTSVDGVWKRLLSDLVTGMDEAKPNIVKKFNLSQNYPNPFNPVTVISYQLPVISHVELKIYDILGREIAILVNEEKPAGTYKISFDGNNLSSGVYFCRLTANEQVKTIKLVLLR